MKMELDFWWSIFAVLIGSYIVVFGFLRRVSDWYYVGKLGEKRHSLPPGDMGWPLLGNILPFFRAFRSSDPDTFINNLVKSYQARNILVKILERILDDRRSVKQQKAKKGMIDFLMELEDESGKKLEGDIIDLILALSFAGHHSPADIAMWATIYLHQHPLVLQKAKEEQEDIVKKRPSSQKGLNLKEAKQMEYFAKVIDETLRITNTPFSEFREAKTDVSIKGYTIPKGWKVFIWNRAVHMDPEVYPAPKEFDPSRWDNHVAKPGSFIPFGGGSRRCPGVDIGKLEVSIFLHYFLLNYKLEQLNPGSLTAYLPGTRPSDNYPAKVIKLK